MLLVNKHKGVSQSPTLAIAPAQNYGRLADTRWGNTKFRNRFDMLKPLTLSDFLPIVGSSFQIQTPPDIPPNPSLQLELLEAVTLSDSTAQDTISSGISSKPISFSLLFKGPVDTLSPQQV